MSDFKIINRQDIQEVSASAIKCNGTVNVTLYLNDGSALDIFGLTIKQADNLESLKFESIKLDARFLKQTEDQWLSQNGIRG